jgi:nucleotide-binding universal stress UspA family protein
VARLAVDHAAALATAFSADLVIAGQSQYKELVLTGRPAETIIEFAHTVGADLLVIGAQHRRFFDDTVIGTTSERLIRHSSTPVLTVVGAETAPSEEWVKTTAGVV